MADLEELVGQSPAIEAVRNDVRRLLALARDGRRLPAVLIQGETGTGKGLVAKLIHRYGPRARGPFVDLNCAAIPETLLEGELFGYERGAFTDARRAKPGLFQTSNGGVLFLDEVALLPEALQAKLLTALEEQAVRRLGSTVKERFDTWLISATNADLERAVRERRFREDLYYRLAVLTIRMPPLRERGDDIIVLAQRFVERACRDYGIPPKSLRPDARARIAGSAWPGNVRELANVVERFALLVDGDDITAADIDAVRGAEPAPAPTPLALPPRTGERERLVAALEATGGNITRTAAALGVTRNTVRSWMERFGLRGPREAAAVVTQPPASAQSAVTAPAPTPALPATPVAGTVRWERRHVTLLRIGLAASDDPAIDGELLLGLATEKVLGFGGRIEALGRTSLDASFGVLPIENATRRAVSAALAVHLALRATGREGLRASTAVHTEQATVGQTMGAVMIDEAGRVVLKGVLDRVIERARPGAVHVSASTAPFVERHFELRPDEPVGTAATFTVVRPDPTGLRAWRKLTPFVGRHTEMELLRSRWALAQRGRGQVVGLAGEAGAGKSRLLLEFAGTLDPTTTLVLRATAAATESPSAPRPAALVLTEIFAIAPGDAAATIRDKVVTRLSALGLEAGLLPPLAALLDAPAEDEAWRQADGPQRARRTLDALRRLVVRESAARPVVLIFEDLHWIDADTQAALDQLIDVVPTARILFLVAFRPEYRHEWTGKSFYTQLRVDPLPPPVVNEFLDNLLGTSADLGPVKGQLLAWTEGNPFFLEEGIRTLVETGTLIGVEGAYRVVGEVGTPTLPATVEDTLAVRMHRLPAHVRHVLQCAAAIGTGFAQATLAAVADLPAHVLHEAIRALEDAEFVYPDVGATEPGHTFKHGLTHLVAYRSMPAERQRVLHGKILAVLEGQHAGQLDALAESLGEHAFRAEAWAKAATYLRQAGGRALGRSAHRVAADYFQRAIVACDRAGDHPELATVAVDLRLDLRHALTPLGEVDRILGSLREAEAIATRVGDTRRLGHIVSFQTNCLFSLGDHTAAIASGHRALTIAQDLGDASMAIAAEQFVGRALHAQGNYRAAAETFRRIVGSLSGGSDSQSLNLPVPPAIFARSHLVACLSELGQFDEGLRVADAAIRLAESVGQPEGLQWACYPLGLLAIDRGDFDTAIAVLERVRGICRDADLPVYGPRTMAALAHARVLHGHSEGIVELERSVADAARYRQVNVYTSALVRLGDAYLNLRRLSDASRTVTQALDLAQRRGERGIEMRALRLLAAVHHLESPAHSSQAETLYREGLALATELGMSAQAVWCQIGLGAVYRVSGRLAEASDILRVAEIESLHLGMRIAGHAARLEFEASGLPPTQS